MKGKGRIYTFLSWNRFKNLTSKEQCSMLEDAIPAYVAAVKRNHEKYRRLTWEYNTFASVISMMYWMDKRSKKKVIDRTTYKLKLKRRIERLMEQIEEEMKELENLGYKYDYPIE